MKRLIPFSLLSLLLAACSSVSAEAPVVEPKPRLVALTDIGQAEVWTYDII